MPALVPLRPLSGDYPGPPLLGETAGTAAPIHYAEHAHPVTLRWVPVHSYRTLNDQTRRPFWRGSERRAYRPVFSIGWNHLPQPDAAAILQILGTEGTVFFAPYSDGLGDPQPALIEVNVLGELPDEDDLRTMRRPLVIEFEGVEVYPLGPDPAPAPAYGAPPEDGGSAPVEGDPTPAPGPPGLPELSSTVDTSAYDPVTDTGNAVTWDWTEPADPQARTPSAYEYRHALPGGELGDWTETAGPSTRTFTVNGGAGVYRAEVRALYADGEIGPAATGSVDVPPGYGDAVRNLRVIEKGTDWVRLAWDAHPDVAAGGYDIKHGEAEGGPYTETDTVALADLDDPAAPEFKVTGLEQTRQYFVVSLTGTADNSNEVSAEPAGSAGAAALVIEKGDLLVGESEGVLQRLPVGTDGQKLKVDSSQALGVAWETEAAPGVIVHGDVTVTDPDGSGGVETVTPEGISGDLELRRISISPAFLATLERHGIGSITAETFDVHAVVTGGGDAAFSWQVFPPSDAVAEPGAIYDRRLVFFTDRSDMTVRVIDAAPVESGSVSAGAGTVLYTITGGQVRGIAWDYLTGDLYVADRSVGTGKMYRGVFAGGDPLDPAEYTWSEFLTGYDFSGIALDGGTLYFSDFVNGGVYRMDLASPGSITTIRTGGASNRIHDVAVYEENLYYCEFDNGRIVRVPKVGPYTSPTTVLTLPSPIGISLNAGVIYGSSSTTTDGIYKRPVDLSSAQVKIGGTADPTDRTQFIEASNGPYLWIAKDTGDAYRLNPNSGTANLNALQIVNGGDLRGITTTVLDSAAPSDLYGVLKFYNGTGWSAYDFDTATRYDGLPALPGSGSTFGTSAHNGNYLQADNDGPYIYDNAGTLLANLTAVVSADLNSFLSVRSLHEFVPGRMIATGDRGTSDRIVLLTDAGTKITHVSPSSYNDSGCICVDQNYVYSGDKNGYVRRFNHDLSGEAVLYQVDSNDIQYMAAEAGVVVFIKQGNTMHRVNADGSGLALITPSGLTAFEFVSLHLRAGIVVFGATISGVRGLYRMDLDGSNVSLITEGEITQAFFLYEGDDHYLP